MNDGFRWSYMSYYLELNQIMFTEAAEIFIEELDIFLTATAILITFV